MDKDNLKECPADKIVKPKQEVFMGGSKPKPVVYQEPPKENDPAVEAALAKEALLARKRKGRASTILSTKSNDPAVGGKTMLGE